MRRAIRSRTPIRASCSKHGLLRRTAILNRSSANLPDAGLGSYPSLGAAILLRIKQKIGCDSSTRYSPSPAAARGHGYCCWPSDPDADVRLFAVTLMATSNNASLMEKAWQVAIRDHDPRIADLAGRLRERREGPLRR